MTSLILSVLAPWWQQIAGLAAAGLAALALYAKGRSDSNQKAKTDDLETANKIRKEGADARARADADNAAGGLRSDDGWRRD